MRVFFFLDGRRTNVQSDIKSNVGTDHVDILSCLTFDRAMQIAYFAKELGFFCSYFTVIIIIIINYEVTEMPSARFFLRSDLLRNQVTEGQSTWLVNPSVVPSICTHTRADNSDKSKGFDPFARHKFIGTVHNLPHLESHGQGRKMSCFRA